MSVFLAIAVSVLAAEYPDADVLTIGDDTRIEYQADGSFVAENDERMVALTEKGRRSLRTVSLGVSRRYGDAEIVKVEITGTNGVCREVDFVATLKESTDNSSNGANIYDPLDRVIACAVPGIEIGETRRVVTRERMLKPRMRDAFATSAAFEAMHPIRSASMEVIVPKGRPIQSVKLRHAVEGSVKRLPDVTLPDGRTRMRWEANNVPQAFPEPDMPDFRSVSQRLLVSTSRDWQEVSRWYWNLCESHLAATNVAMVAKVGELTDGLTDDGAKIRSIFKFVSQEVRYMGLTLEEESPGYAPHDVKVTFDNRYGVCRDKAALLVAMLRIAGLEAYPVLINVGPKMDEDVPLPYFNHAIVWCGELMDPTNESTRDLLPGYLANRSYLIAHPQGKELMVTPVKPAEENVFRIRTAGVLEADGSAVVESELRFDGVNDLFRGAFLKKTVSERRKSFENMLSRAIAGSELLSFEMTPADLRNTSEMLRVRLTARLPDLILRGKTRDELQVPFVFSGCGIADNLLDDGTTLDSRKYPLKLFSTAMTEERISLKVSDALGVQTKAMPDVKSDMGGFRHLRSMTLTNGVFEAVRMRAVDTVEIEPEDYLKLKTELKAIEQESRMRPQFEAVDSAKDANIRWLCDERSIRINSEREWTITNRWCKEILSVSGKKASAEIVYPFNPVIGGVELVSAVVSNRDGSVHAVTPKEMNVLDAEWVASAPRYPAAKKLVVNLPGVEIGSAISVVSVQTITNGAIAYCNMFDFGSRDPIVRREVRIDSKLPIKVMEGANGGVVSVVTNWRNSVVDPKPLPREKHLPPALLWRNSALVSACESVNATQERIVSSLAAARRAGSERTIAKAKELIVGAIDDQAKIRTIRDWLYRHVRMAGPGLFSLPFESAFFPPDRSLADSYASVADWMNLYFTMLEAADLQPEFIFSDDDAAGYTVLRDARINVPQPDDFNDLMIRARGFVLDYENEFTPLGVRDADGRDSHALNHMRIELNETGAARITVSNCTWGTKAGALRKRYAEMLPEMRARHFAELIGNIAESADAISELVTDTESYPFMITYSVYVPNYASVNGDTMSLTVPGIGGTFLPVCEGNRMSPIGLGGRLNGEVIEREVIFPDGFTKVEHLPEGISIRMPDEAKARFEVRVASQMENGKLKVLLREESRESNAAMFGVEWAAWFRDRNRAAGGKAMRTIIVGK